MDLKQQCQRINTLLARLQGLPCWNTVAGEGVGSIFQLDLGGKVLRDKPLTNDLLSEEARKYDGEYNLMVWCSWRLDGPEKPITSSCDPNDNDGPLVRGLDSLVGEHIQSATVEPPAWDLTIRFSGGKTLKVFCDETEESGRIENWHLAGPNGYLISVEPGGKLDINPGIPRAANG